MFGDNVPWHEAPIQVKLNVVQRLRLRYHVEHYTVQDVEVLMSLDSELDREFAKLAPYYEG